jgi:hypothetical protein
LRSPRGAVGGNHHQSCSTTATGNAGCPAAGRGRSAAAQEASSDLRRFLYDDAAATLHVRSYFLNRINPAPPNQAGWAGGGWVGYWLDDILQFGVVGYATQPLWAPPTTDGTELLKPGPYGCWVLDQAHGPLTYFASYVTRMRLRDQS